MPAGERQPARPPKPYRALLTWRTPPADIPSMAHENLAAPALAFDAPGLFALLDALRDDPARYNELDFGLVAMDLDGIGVAARRAIGLFFFSDVAPCTNDDVAPCTNNVLVAGRLETEPSLEGPVRLRRSKAKHRSANTWPSNGKGRGRL